MKIMQLNVWMNKLDRAIIDLIQAEDPDIVCLQEVISYDLSLGFLRTNQEINNVLGYPYTYFSPTFAFQFMHGMPEFGNMVLSKLPIQKKSTQFTNGVYCEDLDFFNKPDSDNIRNFQHVEIALGDQNLNIINHHGYHIDKHKLGDENNLSAVNQIIDFADKLEGPVIIAGDLNLEPNSESIKIIDNAGFKNLAVEYKLNTTRNSLTSKTEICDYIFVNDKVKLKDFYMSNKLVSDHNALFAVID